MANGGTIQFGIKYNVDQSGLNNAKKSLQEIQNLTTKAFAVKTGQGLDQAEKELNEIKKTAAEVERALDNAFSADLGTYNLSKLNQSLKNLDLNKVYNQFSKIGTEGQAAFRKVLVEATTTTNQIRRSHKVLDDFAKTMRNTVQWSITSSIMNTFTGSVEKAYGYVKNLDSSLNDIRIVTNLSAEEMDKFAVKANKAAKALGSSTLDYTKASLIYYQQGLSEQEVEARANVTLKAANVTGQSGEAVSEQLTAIWNGYKVSAEEAELYIDKVSAVAASTAADLEELSTGMSKVASAANAMGVDVDQLNAQLATIVSVTRQAPESVGTALKTIYARMSDLKLGETDEDGLGLGDVTGTMESMGIEVLDATGNLRDMGNVIEDVAAKWDTWTEAQKTAMAQVMAGKRQYNNLVALFENWDMYTDALETSENATGTLAEQNEIYLESVEAHLQQLSTAAEDAYDSMFNADSFKSLIDLGTGLVTIFGDFIDAIGGGGTALTALGGIGLKVFKTQIGESLNTTIKNFAGWKNNLKQIEEKQSLSSMLTNLNMGDSDQDALTKRLISAHSAISQAELKGSLSEEDSQRLREYIKLLAERKDREVDLQKELEKAQKEQEQYNESQKDGFKILEKLGKKDIIEKIAENDKASTEDKSKQAEKLLVDLDKQINIAKEAEKSLNTFEEQLIDHLDELENIASIQDEISQKEQAIEDNKKTYALSEKEYIEQNNISSVKLKKDGTIRDTETYKDYEAAATTMRKKIELDLEFDKDELKEEEKQVVKEAEKSWRKIKNKIEKSLAKSENIQIDILDDQELKNDFDKAKKQLQKLIDTDLQGYTQEEINEIVNNFKVQTENAANAMIDALENAQMAAKNKIEGGDIEKESDMKKAKDAVDAAAADVKEGQDNLNLEIKNIKSEETLEYFADLAGGVLEVVSAMQMIQNLGNIWSDEDLTMGEKLGQTFMSLLTIGGMLITTLPQLNVAWKGITVSFGKAAIAGGAAAAGVGATGAAATGATPGIVAFGTALNTALGPIGWVTLAISALILIIGGLADAYETAEEKAKKFNDLADELNDNANKVKESYTRLIDDISKYQTAENALEKLTKGTSDWKEQIELTNDAVKNLISNSEELAKYVTVDPNTGALTISPEKLSEYQQKQEEVVYQAELGSLVAAVINADNAEKSSVIDIVDQRMQDFPSFINSSFGALGYQGLSQEALQKIMQESIESNFIALERFQEIIKEDLINAGVMSEASAGQVVENDLYIKKWEETNAWLKQQAEKEEITGGQTKMLLYHLLQQDSSFSSSEIAIITESLKNMSIDGIAKNPFEKEKELTDEDKVSYAEMAGLYYDIGQKQFFTDSSMSQSKVVDDNVIKEFLKVLDNFNNAISFFKEQYNEYFDKIDQLNISNEGKNLIKQSIANQDFSVLKQLSSVDLDILSKNQDILKDAYQSFLNEGITLPMFLEGVQFQRARERKDLLQEANWEESDTEEINDFDPFSDNQIYISKSFLDQIKAIGKENSDILANILYSYNESEQELILNTMNKFNWTQVNALSQFNKELEQLGFNVDLSSDKWKAYIATIQKIQLNSIDLNSILIQTQDALSDIDTITSDLEVGSIISKEDFDRLQQLSNKDLSQYFDKETTLDTEGKEIVTYTFKANFVPTEDSQTFADYLKTDIINIEDIQNAYEEQSKLAQLIIYQGFKDLDDVNSQLNQVFSNQSLVDYLSGVTGQNLSRDTFSDLTDPIQLANWQSIWEYVLQLISNFENGLLDATASEETFVKYFVKDYNQLIKAYSQGQISYKTYHKERMAFIQTELEALDITQEQFNSYLGQLQREYPDMSDVQIEQFAIQTYKLNQGMKELISNWDDWNKVLSNSSKTAPEYNEALKAMNSSTAKLLGLSDAGELIGSQGEQFLEAEENRQLIYDITVKGDYEKIIELRQKYAEWKVKVSVELQDSEIQEQLPITINKISSEFDKLEVGDSLSKSLQDEIKTMISDAGDGALDIIEILSGLGASISGTQLLLKTLSWTSEDWTNAIMDPKAYGLGDYKEELYALDNNSNLTHAEIGQQLTNRWISNLTVTKGPGADAEAVKKSIDTEEMEEARNSAKKSQWEKDTKLKDTEKKAKAEYDRYHDVNIEIQKQIDLLDKLQNEEDELVGQAYLDNLEQQNAALEEQNRWIEEKIKLKKEEAAELHEALELQGMEFDEEGDISNYLSKMKGLVEKINAAQAEVNKANKDYNDATREEAEKIAQDRIDFAQGELDKLLEQYEWLKELIEKYEQIQHEDLVQLESEKEANIDKQIENEIKSLNYSIDVDLDLADAERQWNEFKWKVLEKGSRFSLFGDNILGEAEMLMQNLQTYPESISGLMNQVQKYMDIINGGGQFSAGADMAAAIENAEKYRDELMATMESVEDAIQQIQQLYLDMIDAAKDAFDDHIAQYELINEILEHNISLIEKLDGEDSFDALGKYYEQMEQNNNANLAFQKEQVEFWKQRMEAEEYGSEAWLKYKENWQNAMSELNSAVEASVDNLIAKYQNTISSIMADLTASLTGNNLGLDFLGEEWNLINENADAYLDKINSMFAIDELQGKYMDAINNTDNLEVQERLTKVMNEQVAALEEKGKLTEYDVKRANLLYEIELKKIALEEAQQNKSKMRLRRDSQGNYSYQFTADEDAIAKTQSELDQLQNSLYNLDKEAYRNNLNEVYDVYAEFQEKLKKLYADQTLSDEEREAKREMLVQQYGERINGLVTENEFIRANLYDSTFQELAKMYDTDIDHFKNMSQAEQDLLMQEMIPQWDTGIQTMIDKFSAEGGFGPIVAGTLNKLQEEHSKYEQDLEEMAEAAGINLDAIRGGYDTVHESVKQLIEQSEGELMNTWDEQLDKMSALVDSLADYDRALDSTRQAVGDLIEELNKLIAKQKEANGGTVSPSSGGNKPSDKPSNNPPTGGGSGGDKKPSDDKGKDTGKPKDETDSSKVKKVTLAKGDDDFYDTAYDSTSEPRQEQWKNGGTVWVGWNKNAKSWVVNDRAAIYASEAAAKNHITNPSGIAWVDKKLVGLDTGGYTGQWGSEGKVAMLHEKELVLNKADTENILTAVDIVRTISGVIDNLERNVSARMFDLSNLNIPQYTPTAQDTQTIEQQVHIDATFPNVQNSNEIEEAFNNLVNIASQHAFKTKR